MTAARQTGSRTFSGIMLVVVLVAGYFITKAAPNSDKLERSFLTTAHAGESVTTRQFIAKVTGVRYATILKEGTKTRNTDGAWVLVKVSFTALSKEIIVDYGDLVSGDGRTFAPTDRVTQNMLSATLQPGIPAEGEIVFEVPRSSLGQGISVRFGVIEHILYGLRKDAMANIILTEQGEASWLEPATITYNPEVKR